jgi:hypothetical protein
VQARFQRFEALFQGISGLLLFGADALQNVDTPALEPCPGKLCPMADNPTL